MHCKRKISIGRSKPTQVLILFLLLWTRPHIKFCGGDIFYNFSALEHRIVGDHRSLRWIASFAHQISKLKTTNIHHLVRNLRQISRAVLHNADRVRRGRKILDGLRKCDVVSIALFDLKRKLAPNFQHWRSRIIDKQCFETSGRLLRPDSTKERS